MFDQYQIVLGIHSLSFYFNLIHMFRREINEILRILLLIIARLFKYLLKYNHEVGNPPKETRAGVASTAIQNETQLIRIIICFKNIPQILSP